MNGLKLIKKITIFTICLYIFFYQFSYPFPVALLLIFSTILFCFLLINRRQYFFNLQTIIFILILISSLAGVFYTDNMSAGLRESMIMISAFLIFWSNQNNCSINRAIQKHVINLCYVILGSIYLQYLLPSIFNDIMKFIVRTDCYDQLMWSYVVDHAYAGISCYVMDSAFMSAILYGLYSFKLLDIEVDVVRNHIKRNNILVGLLVVASLYAVFLTSKRGILLGMMLSIFFAFIFRKNIRTTDLIKIFGLAAFLILIIVVLYCVSDEAKAFLSRFIITGGKDITTGRSSMYVVAISRLFTKGKFLFGFGTGATYTLFSNGLHNIYLQLIYDHGIIGSLPYFLFFILNIVIAFKLHDYMSCFIQLLMLIYGMTGNPLYSNTMFLIYLFSVAGFRWKPKYKILFMQTINKNYSLFEQL